jgi:hypothetical protein
MVNNGDLDEQLLRKMFNVIRTAEIKNIKTQKKDDKGMIRSIETYVIGKVEEEMKKNEN